MSQDTDTETSLPPNPPAPEPLLNGFLPGIFIGNGKHVSRAERPDGYAMFGVWPVELAFDAAGNVLPTRDPATGLYKNPQELPEFDHWGPVSFSPGEVVPLPVANQTLFVNVLASELFVREEFYKDIEEMQAGGKSWIEIATWAKEKDAYIKPQDEDTAKALKARLKVLGRPTAG
jgi:hypothetical protein